MRPRHPPLDAPALSLITGGYSSSAQGLVPLPPSSGEWSKSAPATTLPRRPGDHLELWTFASTDTLRDIRRGARERGLSPDTAVTLICERRLAYEDLDALGLNQAPTALGAVAAEAKASLPMWPANRSYLRTLRCGDPLERTFRAPLGAPHAAVPIRLVDRLGAGEVLAESLEPGELASAINCEAAALCAGKLLAEWALATALRAAAS